MRQLFRFLQVSGELLLLRLGLSESLKIKREGRRRELPVGKLATVQDIKSYNSALLLFLVTVLAQAAVTRAHRLSSL